MTSSGRFLVSVGLACALQAAAEALPARHHDNWFVARGCVAPTTDLRGTDPQPLFLWSRGDVYLAHAETPFEPLNPRVGAAAMFQRVFYWIDHEDDLARYVGLRVEVAGELDDVDEGDIEIDYHGDYTELEFKVNGHKTKARIPTTWLWPATGGRDVEFDVAVRTVDVERVTVLGACVSR
jgi:hypothetical protein